MQESARLQSVNCLRIWPQDGLERVEVCPICSSERRRLLHKDLSDKVFKCAPGLWDMYQCQVCRTAYLDPRPTVSTIGQAYSTYFTHSQSVQEDYRDLGYFRRLKRAMANGYRNHRFGTSLHPSTKLGVVFSRTSLKFRNLLDAERRCIPPGGSGKRLLDIGCGNGDFLMLAAQGGWEVVGLEPDPKAAGVARGLGLDVRQQVVESLDPAVERFDGITLSHVIEHLHDPVSALQHCYSLLKPDGWIWIETPNLDAQGHETFGPSWRGLEPPRHLVIFNRPSLFDLLRKVGFVDLKDLPYRPLCDSLFKASDGIAKELNENLLYVTPGSLEQQISIAERRAKQNVALREFVTVRASKPNE
jgi:2-polyprenyl-3-methyl-5-hydroxy-6-metoxy-1,4-benzoquinol methylase